MNSPAIWILFPALLSIPLALFRNKRKLVFSIGVAASTLLALIAWTVPVDTVLNLGAAEYKLSSTLTILGRELVISSTQQTIILLIFGMTAFWLIGAFAISGPSLFPAASLLMNAFLVASLAVVPFLYAAILIEMACLVTLPVFFQSKRMLGSGALRFLTFQTMGMTLLLLSGWLLGGVETAPASQIAVLRVLIILGLGLAFMLAIFPFYSWIPMLTEQEDTYFAGFVILSLQTAILFFVLNFFENYAWLRRSVELQQAMVLFGAVMVVTGGVWSAFQKNLSRMFGYALIAENGLSLITIGLMSFAALRIFSGMFLARILAFGVWALCLSIIKSSTSSFMVEDLKGFAKGNILIVMGLLVAQFSIGGMPLLAGFPLRVALLQEISLASPGIGWSILVSIVGLWAAGWYTLSVVINSSVPWKKFLDSNTMINFLIIIGVVSLIVLGLFPQLYTPIMEKLLMPFTHLL